MKQGKTYPLQFVKKKRTFKKAHFSQIAFILFVQLVIT